MDQFNPQTFIGIADVFSGFLCLFCTLIYKFSMCHLLLCQAEAVLRFPLAVQGHALLGETSVGCWGWSRPWLEARCLTCGRGITELSLPEGRGGDHVIASSCIVCETGKWVYP